MWGKKSRERREADRARAATERLVARARELVHEVEWFKRRAGRRPIADVQTDIFAFFRDAVPLTQTEPVLALALLDLAPLSMQAAAAGKDWHRTAMAGAVLSSAMLAVRMKSNGIDVQLERELGRLLGAHVDLYLFALAQLPEICHVGANCDLLLEGGFSARQYVQMADPDVRHAWDLATGVIANGGAGLTDAEIREVREHGGWTSERQRGDLDPDALVSTMLTWASNAMDQMKDVASLSTLHQGGDADAAWAVMLAAADAALTAPPTIRLPIAEVSGCITPLAARESGRDIVYLIAGLGESAAVRYHGGDDWRHAPEVLRLPGVGIEEIRRVARDLDGLGRLSASDLVGRTALMNHALDGVGRLVAGPVVSRWPGISKVTLIPVGEMRELPLSNALVGGRRLNDLIEVTIAPNSATVLIAAGGRPAPQPHEAVVMADPANGDIHLPWVVEEAMQVAAVYGKRPDHLVEYGADDIVSATAGQRSSLMERPVFNVTSEHVLTQIESAGVVHLACHGILPENGDLPALLIHGVLAFDALEHHRFADGATVVLSACSVGQSIRDAPFAMLGFPTMLLSTGASAVIASSRPLLDSKETVEFMVLLHQHLRAGETAAKALALAIRDAEQRGIPSAVWGSLEVHGATPAALG